MNSKRLVGAVFVIITVVAVILSSGFLLQCTLNNTDDADLTANNKPNDIDLIQSNQMKQINEDNAHGPAVMDDEALNSRLNDIFGSATYSIAVIDLTDGTIIVDVDADDTFFAASVYKLFIGYSMIRAVENNNLSWDSYLYGMPLRQCFEKMLVESNNECPVAWLTSISSNERETEQAQQFGAYSTSFLEYPVVTTASDAARLLERLYRHEGISDDSAEYMLDCLSRQIYRSGIPAGLKNIGEVQDKVGFLDGVLNDTAVIYTPKGDYVISIFTVNASWPQIAEAARILYEYL